MSRAGKLRVELEPDHPGFKDTRYRARRDTIARIATEHQPGDPIPRAPYVAEENQVWAAILRALTPLHERLAPDWVLAAYQALALPQDRIPQLSELSAKTEAFSGFRMEPVPGLVEASEFLGALAEDRFLSTQYIRHHSVPSYTPEPDIVHEVVGHGAHLADASFAQLNRLFGKAALRISGEAMDSLASLYWYTLEFGVVIEHGVKKAYGAGLLSSFGEIQEIEAADLRPFDIQEMETQSFATRSFQNRLYVAESHAQIIDSLSKRLEQIVAAGTSRGALPQ